MFKLSFSRFFSYATLLPAWSVYVALYLTDLSSAIKFRFDPVDVIVRDVAVVGGGASGTYAAIRLQQDFNKSGVMWSLKEIFVEVEAMNFNQFHRVQILLPVMS